MAAYPCQRCDQRFEGEARNAYLTIFEGDDKAAFRYVICSGCLEELAEEWLRRGLHRGEHGDWETPTGDELLIGVFF
jgi:hypothetical protein